MPQPNITYTHNLMTSCCSGRSAYRLVRMVRSVIFLRIYRLSRMIDELYLRAVDSQWIGLYLARDSSLAHVTRRPLVSLQQQSPRRRHPGISVQRRHRRCYHCPHGGATHARACIRIPSVGTTVYHLMANKARSIVR